MNRITSLLIFCCLILLNSCVENISPELPPAENIYVVEGWLSTIYKKQEVSFSRSIDFYNSKKNIPITNAKIMIISSQGDTIQFIHSQNEKYLSKDAVSGETNVAYRLLIDWENNLSISSNWDTLKAQIPIESVEAISSNIYLGDDENKNKVLRIKAIDPPNHTDYYRWVLYQNGEKILFSDPPFRIFNDALFNGNFIINNFNDYFFETSDSLTIELHHISKFSFEFLNQMNSLITNNILSGVNSNPSDQQIPINLKTNQDSVKLIGFFGTRAISSINTVVD